MKLCGTMESRFYMQPGTNFSHIDDMAHKYGVDLHIAG